MAGTSETVTLEFTRYRTPKGKPTCAIDWDGGKICMFMGVSNFGCKVSCLVNPGASIENRKNRLGYTVPHKDCVMWKGEK